MKTDFARDIFRIFEFFSLYRYGTVRYEKVRYVVRYRTVSDGIGRYRTVSYRIVPEPWSSRCGPKFGPFLAVVGALPRGAAARRCRAGLPRSPRSAGGPVEGKKPWKMIFFGYREKKSFSKASFLQRGHPLEKSQAKCPNL